MPSIFLWTEFISPQCPQVDTVHDKPLATTEEVMESSTYSDDGEMLPVAKKSENCKSEGVSDEIQHPKSNTEEVMAQSSTYSDNGEMLSVPKKSENCKSEGVADEIQHPKSNTAEVMAQSSTYSDDSGMLSNVSEEV